MVGAVGSTAAERWAGLAVKRDTTVCALKHTVSTFIQIKNYLFYELHVSYVLTGKFQTDCLEFRFSQYRQLEHFSEMRLFLNYCISTGSAEALTRCDGKLQHILIRSR